MNRICITQVFKISKILKILSNLFWVDENPIQNFPETTIHFKEDWIISLYKYKDKATKNGVWQMKYRANRNMARFFGQKMAKILIENKLENYTLVPIPIHWRRRFERGFNQSEWLCKEITKTFNKNYSGKENKIVKIKFKKILKRVVYNKKQSWNNKLMRQKNILAVFQVKEKFKKEIVGQKFLLVDDVVTTGATIKEARHELLIRGASSVKALTVAY